MSYRECCKRLTMWTIEVETWTVKGVGIDKGGVYIGISPKPCTPYYPSIGTLSDCIFRGRQKAPGLKQTVTRLSNRKVRRELRTLISACDDGCVCTTGGKLIRTDDVKTTTELKGVETRISRANCDSNSGWITMVRNLGGEAEYGDPNGNGWEEFRFGIQLEKKIQVETWQNDHQCGDCCQENDYVDNIYNRVEEYEKWLKTL